MLITIVNNNIILNIRVQFIGEFQQLSIKNGRTTQQQRQATSVATQETPDTGPAFEPSYVYKILPAFEEGRQEDAEEFMSYLLNGINDEMIEVSYEMLATIHLLINILFSVN